MRTSRFTTRSVIDHPVHRVFPFFADAANLELITPPWLGFEILTPLPISMRAGATIDYRIRWRGVPIRWQTEITVWEPPYRFVDVQVSGPYRVWEHEHLFWSDGETTVMEDRVDSAVWGGRLVESLVVKRDIERIFGFRRAAFAEIFRPGIVPSPNPGSDLEVAHV